MKITAISDIHGSLIPIEPTDLLIIAGDWSPLEIQTNGRCMSEWIDHCLLPWFKEISAVKIVFIAGNHDFICDPTFTQTPLLDAKEYSFKDDLLYPYLNKHHLLNKVTYLDSSYTTYKGLKIYGCPYVDGCTGWAFSQGEYKGVYDNIPKCDVLITHQPPLFNNLGSIEINGIHKEFGSWLLMETIKKRKPRYVFSGHIHEGDHAKQIYRHSTNEVTDMYNCSIKNESYNVFYNPLVINI